MQILKRETQEPFITRVRLKNGSVKSISDVTYCEALLHTVFISIPATHYYGREEKLKYGQELCSGGEMTARFRRDLFEYTTCNAKKRLRCRRDASMIS